MTYFEDLITYWQANLNHVIPAKYVYLGRQIQDPPQSVFAVIFPLESPEPEEDTGGTMVETLPFAIHIHGTSDEVLRHGKTLWKKAPAGLAWAPINASTLGMIRKSRRYIRDGTELHHYFLTFDWITQDSE